VTPARGVFTAPGPLPGDPGHDRPAPSAELVLVSSGPGEVSNWAAPMAEAASAWAASRGAPLTISLILPPCQFASGQEVAYARRRGPFARVLGPRACLALVAGFRRLPVSGPGCVLHLGGDLWYTATLGQRLGFPALAYVETELIRKRAHRFRRIFVPSQRLADRLVSARVPRDLVRVVGDLRVDHLASFRAVAGAPRRGIRVALLPGSRGWIVEGMLPFLLDTAAAMRAVRSEISCSVIASPFLAPDALGRLLAPHRERLRALEIDVVQDERLQALAECDLAITLPGTNTVELAVLGVPMLVVLPLDRPGRIRTEGMSEWVSRLPGLGTAIKTTMARRFARRGQLVAWPNREAGRQVVPEMVGSVVPAEVARRALALLSDPAEYRRTGEVLRGLYATPPGVAERMLEEMTPWLRVAPGRRTAFA
jgi:lipid-A-disaccharide synthase